ncbi:isocitrate lyase/phosphoenolpyruvate mutase family protein [Micromonospora sp. A3M-1-15]|uniref:isocitrate lyase/phosphoenolpyruvate mutase family protein n=1 Tax=Micromonospora sp. A3M-1-15 TaxID=2962035 RepID=UPI0035B0A33E
MSDIAAQLRYEQFVEVHRGPDTFIMPDAWDVPAALLFKEAGSKSIATCSAAFAATPGRPDGSHAISRDAP